MKPNWRLHGLWQRNELRLKKWATETCRKEISQELRDLQQSTLTITMYMTLLSHIIGADLHCHLWLSYLYGWFHSTVTGFQSCSSRSPICTHADKVKQQLQELCPLHSNQHKQPYELCPLQLDQHKKATKEFPKKCLREGNQNLQKESELQPA
jgi:hypothetical protein